MFSITFWDSFPLWLFLGDRDIAFLRMLGHVQLLYLENKFCCYTPILCYKATKVSSLFSPWFEVHLPSDLLHRKVHPFSSDTIQQILCFRWYWVQWGHQLQSLERQDFGLVHSFRITSCDSQHRNMLNENHAPFQQLIFSKTRLDLGMEFEFLNLMGKLVQ